MKINQNKTLSLLLLTASVSLSAIASQTSKHHCYEFTNQQQCDHGSGHNKIKCYWDTSGTGKCINTVPTQRNCNQYIDKINCNAGSNGGQSCEWYKDQCVVAHTI